MDNMWKGDGAVQKGMQTEGLADEIERYRDRFVQNVVWMREKLGLPVKTLADAAQIERKTYYNLIDGTFAPEFRSLVSIAHVLGVADPGDLLMEPAMFQLRYRKAKPPTIRVVIERSAPAKVKAAKRTLGSQVVHLHERRRVVH